MIPMMKLRPCLCIHLLLWIVAGLALALPATADDTDVFFGRTSDALETNPNILFILDTSGSMTSTDGGSLSRIDRLKLAMTQLLDQSSSYNVGLMGFSGYGRGGAIRYPIGYLESDSGELCDNGICDDEVVVVRGGDGRDDATQNDATGEVVLDALSLRMSQVDTSSTDDPDPATPTNLVQGSSRAVSEVAEAQYRPSGAVFTRRDRAVNTWFHYGADDYSPDRYAYRFENVTVPAGATVTAAHITFTHSALVNQAGNVSAYIRAESTVDPAPYPSGVLSTDTLAPRFDPARVTSTPIAWEFIPPVNLASADSAALNDATEPTLDSPDLSTVLTELVSLPGWNSGNAMSFLVYPFDDYQPSAADVRSFVGSQGTADKVPVLHYTYTSDSMAFEQTTVYASSHLDEVTDQNWQQVSRNHTNAVSRLFHAGPSNEPRRLALRFEDLDIPEGATIQSATLSLNTAANTDVEDDPANWLADPDTGNAALSDTSAATPDADTNTDSSATGEPSGAQTAAPVVNANITLELSSDPAPYVSGRLSARGYVNEFVTWPALADTPASSISSPDLATLFNKLVSDSQWNTGGDVSLLLSAPGDYANLSDNTRRVLTAAASTGARPALTLQWQSPQGQASQSGETQTTALRFRDVHVPPGATIRDARLVFHSAAANSEATSLTISSEDIANSEPFQAQNNNLGDRALSSERVVWNVPAWEGVNQKQVSDDLSRVIQTITDRTDWCGGNALTLFLKGTGLREAVTFEQNEVRSPALHITYAPESVAGGSYCSNSSVVVPVATGGDDVQQDLDSDTMNVTSTSLTLAGSGSAPGAQALGLRFRGVEVPQGAVVVSAALVLTGVEQITDEHAFNIRIQVTDDAPAFQNRDKDLTERSFSGPVQWNSHAAAAADESVFTADIAPLVRQVTSRSGWQPGSAMAFRLDADAAAMRRFAAWESSPAQAARLIIYFQSERLEPGTRFRENLQQAVDELVAQSYTPIVDAYYEAALYYRGGAVDYGRRRGAQGLEDRFHRVSHPFSYSGGRVYRAPGCSDSNLDAEACTDEEILDEGSSTPEYNSPIQSQCQANHIVLLSDGKPVSNSAVSKVQDLIGTTCGGNGDGQCGPELASWLAATDHASQLPGRQNITTHTVAFNLKKTQFLKDLAQQGGGGFYSANSANELLKAFQSIFINVSKTDTSFVAPSATISQFNRTRNREDLYFSLFKPEANAHWPGNLKRYKLQGNSGGTADIVDANGHAAVDPETGLFRSGAQSFWSSQTDGSSVQLGGAAEQLGDQADWRSRKVYTWTGGDGALASADGTHRLRPDNSLLDADWFDLPPGRATDDDYFEELVQWSAGRDVYDIDGDDDRDESRGQMGDPMHSQPVIVNYGSGTTLANSIVFVATNDGFLHAIEHATGEERFAFIPRELLANLQTLHTNEPTRRRPYGLDGGMSVWIDDTDGNGMVNGSDKAYLYIGMRRGGNRYYALDITDIDNPRYLWSIEGGRNVSDDGDTGTADGDYTELADTWSTPVRTRLFDGTSERDVLVFGAGYDKNQDPPATDTAVPGADPDATDTASNASTRRPDGSGRGIFIADARTGERLWHTPLNNGAFSQMLYSVPSQIRVIDIDFDGLADQLYSGDMGGQVWRIDINNNPAASGTLSQRITGGRVAELANDAAGQARRFYYPPSVSVISAQGRQQLAVSIGSGWRAAPLDEVVNDRFYSFRLNQVYGAPIDSQGVVQYPLITESTTGFTNITDALGTSPDSTSRGWFLDLPGTGEKVLAPSVTADNTVVFTTYLPATSISACAAAVGSGKVYALNLNNGDPVLDLDNSGDDDSLGKADRGVALANEGIPPPPSVLFPETGNPTFVIGAQALDELTLQNRPKQSFWQEHSE